MPRVPPEDKKELKVDLLETLVANGIFGPESVPIDVVLDWFSLAEQEIAQEIIEEMHSNEESPLKYEIGDHSKVWLRDKQEAIEYIEFLRDQPPWYEFHR